MKRPEQPSVLMKRPRGRAGEATPEPAALESAPPPPPLVVRLLQQLLFVPWAGVLVGLAAICIYLAIASPQFLTSYNLSQVSVNFSWICITGFGEALVIIGGGLDLSVGSTMGFAGMVAAMALTANWPVALAVGAGMLSGLVIGLINGLVITRIGLNPFITTLGMLSVVRGLTYGIVGGGAVTVPDGPAGAAFSNLGVGAAGTVPYPVIVLVVLGILATIGLNQTRWGRYIYAVGGNESATRMLGINVRRMKVWMYVICAVIASIGGILLTAKSGTALPDAAVGYELNVIAAVIIGGTSLSGGRGTVAGVLVGAALLGVINNGLVLIGLAGYWQQTVIGLVIILAATLDVIRERLRRS